MRTAKERTDIAAASENLEALMQQKAGLEAQLDEELKALEGSADPLKQTIETVAERPRKSDIEVRLVSLVWIPSWKTGDGIPG